MNIFAVQLDIAWENRDANHHKAQSLLAGCNIPENSMIILPEMFSSGFSMNVAATREESPSATEALLVQLAKEYRSWVFAGLVTAGENREGKNQALMVDPKGSPHTRYTKIQTFNLGGEGTHYDAGDQVIVFPCGEFIICPFVCYDLRFPEIWRLGARQGAEVFVDIANWPSIRVDHWVTLLRARAIENLAYVIGVNRCGKDPKIEYPGRTMVVDPHGEIIADAGEEEGVLEAEIHREQVADWRAKFPALQDMRPEFLG